MITAKRPPLTDIANELADAHREADPDTLGVYLAPDPSEQEIRLVEVSRSVGTTGEVLPFRFGARADQGIPYPSVVVLLSPEEWEQLSAGKLQLPATWGPVEALVELNKAS